MKKMLYFLLLCILCIGMGCEKNKKDNDKTIVIGTSVISKDVLEEAQKVFNKENKDYKMEVKLFDDAITPNLAVDDGSIDGNFYQYEDYLNNFNKQRGTNLKSYGKPIFAFQIGLYSEKINNIKDIENNMTVAIANDNTNRSLALNLLAKHKIIKIREGVKIPTILDITENKYNLKFIEMERLNLANSLEDVDMAIVMSDVMLHAGKNSEKALAFDQEQGIVLVVKEEKEWSQLVENSLMSDEVRKFILEKTKGTKTPLF